MWAAVIKAEYVVVKLWFIIGIADFVACKLLLVLCLYVKQKKIVEALNKTNFNNAVFVQILVYHMK